MFLFYIAKFLFCFVCCMIPVYSFVPIRVDTVRFKSVGWDVIESVSSKVWGGTQLGSKVRVMNQANQT